MVAGQTTKLIRILAVLCLAGCAAAPPLGEPLRVQAGTGGYRFRAAAAERRSDDLLLLVTFSGGGHRAAAMAYGALEQLAADPVTTGGRRGRLLDQVDVISAVSGGSIVGAYYVLYGDALFERFRADYLDRDVQSALLGRMFFSPIAWRRLVAPSYARGDLFADYLDRRLFHGATFADLAAQQDRPFLVINATDLSAAGRFEFTQGWFDIICADLGRFPLARAVAASSAYPVLMAPITLRNHAGQCGYELRRQPDLDARDAGRHAVLHERLQAYQDQETIRYLHLADGAMSDNLGIRAAIDTMLQARDFDEAQRSLGLAGIRRIAVIAVDAAGEAAGRVAGSARTPGVMDTAALSSMVLVDENGAESRALLRELMTRMAGTAPAGMPPVETYWVDVRLDDLADATRRQRLRTTPTNLHVKPAQVDELVCSTRELLQQSVEYRRLLHDLQVGAPAGNGCQRGAR